MAIPTRQDYSLAELENLHSVVMVRCRAFVHAGQRRDPAGIRDALVTYADAVIAFIKKEVDQ